MFQLRKPFVGTFSHVRSTRLYAFDVKSSVSAGPCLTLTVNVKMATKFIFSCEKGRVLIEFVQKI